MSLFRRDAVDGDAHDSARAWTLLSTIATRGAGFTVSFFVARYAGVQSLGTYTAMLNTASAVVSPFSSVVGNNATVMAAAAHRLGPATYARVARAAATLASGLSLLSFMVFLTLNPAYVNHGQGVSLAWVAIGGASVIFGQALFAVIRGCLHGAGGFVPVARLSAVVAFGVMLFAGPLLWWVGLTAAFTLLVVLSLLPSAIMASQVLSLGETTGPGSVDVWAETWSRFVAGLAGVLATSVDNAVNWICAIYLVRRSFGMEGIGILAVAAQWLTAMLLPVMSWSGITLKALSDAVGDGDPSAVFGVVVRLTKKNLLATAALAGLVCVCSRYLASAYGLGGSDLAILICFNGAVALTNAANVVPELLMVCLRRQRLWLAFSLVAFGIQAVVTYAWIGHGLWVVVLGILAANVTRGLLCLAALPRLVQAGTRA